MVRASRSVRSGVGGANSSRSTRGDRATLACISIGAMLCCAGCSTVGASVARGDRMGFNEAGSESAKEQMLLNIVRVRDGKPMYIVEIGSVISQPTFQASGSALTFHNDQHGIYGPALRSAYPVRGDDVVDPTRQTTAAGSLQYSDTPTISYHALASDELSRRVMTPIPAVVILYLSECGWSLDRLLDCCVQRINGLNNRAIGEAGATRGPEPGFTRTVQLLKQLEDTGQVAFSFEKSGGEARAVLHLPASISGLEAEMRELRERLGYPLEGALALRVTGEGARSDPDEISLQTRSILGVFQALALECGTSADRPVEKPAEATTGRTSRPGVWLRVDESFLPPSDAFVRVPYEGRWTYIPKSDFNSKRTLSLLTYLFSLRAADVAGPSGPILTVGAGGR